MTEPTKMIDGRIVGGFSWHERHNPELCKRPCRPNWRVVQCGGLAGKDRDIVECSTCGEQRNVSCNFDEDFA